MTFHLLWGKFLDQRQWNVEWQCGMRCTMTVDKESCKSTDGCFSRSTACRGGKSVSRVNIYSSKNKHQLFLKHSFVVFLSIVSCHRVLQLTSHWLKRGHMATHNYNVVIWPHIIMEKVVFILNNLIQVKTILLCHKRSIIYEGYNSKSLP